MDASGSRIPGQIAALPVAPFDGGLIPQARDARCIPHAVFCLRLDHFHFYFALVEIRSVRPFFGGTAASSTVPRGTPKVKMA
jgi:hypothetical protein